MEKNIHYLTTIISISKSFIFALCLVIGVFFPGIHSSYAQGSGSISGIVVDKASSEALLFATVRLEGTSLGTSADNEAKFMLRQIPAGEYKLTATYIGYVEQTMSVSVVAGQTIKVRVELEYAGYSSEEVVISAQVSGQMSAINEQLSSNTIKNVVSADRIQDVPDVNAAESVARLPGVSLIRNGGEGQKVAVRGMSP